ncbi:bifunctional riboflavin kinase/FAD synthetase [Pleurocapsa sp. FMAR1]|uniref:bifunctional riboflavin kinase/FAD synthetase n=1 Tax=Pleurocapsa sp. FMAR1 TaxID=3040204 RepID=UPI0029C80F83|nr:bifunctional riboflavin kinase/FAD synthetase [Pleurocapsa sp. FMAR1]
MLIASSTEQFQTPTAIALGNFDGIHQGHQIVLQPIIDGQSQKSGHVCPSVVSFTPHPREFFTGGQVQLLTPVAEKADLLASMGIEQLILLPFDRNLASLSPQQFVEQIIVQQLQARKISVGSDFRFGWQRKGTGEDLRNIAANFGITVQLNSLHKYQDADGDAVRVSSSLIKQALLNGEITAANALLGRPYSLIGEVVSGQQLGRTIGFPTANIKPPAEKFLPRFGVYAADVFVDRATVKGVLNIGCRPTVAGKAATIEVHLLNWSGNLYGQTLKVNLLDFLRPEQKFDSVEELKQQITKDCQAALNN